MSPLVTVISAAPMLTATAAQAHTGVVADGLAHGLAHPLGGIDHVLAMISVGLLASHLGGRALWLVPLSFLSMMVVGGIVGVTGAPLPLVEIGIGVSVVILGLTLALGVRVPTAAAAAIVGLFAIFHGHAHGVEMPPSVAGLEYGTGFVLATAALHLAGIGLGRALGSGGGAFGRRALQTGGAVLVIAGAVMLTG